MITIEATALRRIEADAEHRYPEEACGLLIGRRDADGSVDVSEAHPGANIAERERQRRFEIDPALRFRLVRALSARPETIVGHYHSHPDRPAAPSAHDRRMAFEPDLVWLIAAVTRGRAVETAGFRIGAAGVQRLELRIREAERAHPEGCAGHWCGRRGSPIQSSAAASRLLKKSDVHGTSQNGTESNRGLS